MSPLFLVAPGDPPMLVLHGRADPLVPIEQAEALVHALRVDGAPVQVIFHAGGHGIRQLPQAEQRALLETAIALWPLRRER